MGHYICLQSHFRVKDGIETRPAASEALQTRLTCICTTFMGLSCLARCGNHAPPHDLIFHQLIRPHYHLWGSSMLSVHADSLDPRLHGYGRQLRQTITSELKARRRGNLIRLNVEDIRNTLIALFDVQSFAHSGRSPIEIKTGQRLIGKCVAKLKDVPAI